MTEAVLKPWHFPALLALALVAAMFFSGLHLWPYSVTLITLLAATLLTWYRAGISGASGAGVSTAGAVLILLWLWYGVSVSWSEIPYMSSLHFWLFGAAPLAYLSWKMHTGGSDVLPGWLLPGMVLLGAVFAIVVAWQWGTGQDPGASFANRNSAAAFLNLLWLPAAALLLGGWKSRYGWITPWIALAAIAVMVFATGLIGSRGALLGGFLALCCILAVQLKIEPRHKLAWALLAVYAGALSLAHLVSGGLVGDRMATLLEPAIASVSRLHMWGATLHMIAERPLLGFGPGVYWQVYPAHRPLEDGSAGYHAHNDYLQFWVEGGLPALLLLLALMCIVGFRVFRHLAAALGGRRELSHACLGFFAGLLAVAVHSLFTFNLQLLAVLLLCGIYLAVIEDADDAAPVFQVPAPGGLTRALRWTLLAAVAASILHLASVGASHAVLVRADHHADAQRFDEAEELYKLSATLWGAPDIIWHKRADMYRDALSYIEPENRYMRESLFRDGMTYLDRAQDRNPHGAIPYAVRARLLHRHPDLAGPDALDHAEEEYRRALQRNPLNHLAVTGLTELLAETGRTEAALELLGATLAYRGPQRRDILERYHELYSEQE